jgi:hypothetical protein
VLPKVSLLVAEISIELYYYLGTMKNLKFAFDVNFKANVLAILYSAVEASFHFPLSRRLWSKRVRMIPRLSD